jgi:hypothetical protein
MQYSPNLAVVSSLLTILKAVLISEFRGINDSIFWLINANSSLETDKLGSNLLIDRRLNNRL